MARTNGSHFKITLEAIRYGLEEDSASSTIYSSTVPISQPKLEQCLDLGGWFRSLTDSHCFVRTANRYAGLGVPEELEIEYVDSVTMSSTRWHTRTPSTGNSKITDLVHGLEASIDIQIVSASTLPANTTKYENNSPSV